MSWELAPQRGESVVVSNARRGIVKGMSSICGKKCLCPTGSTNQRWRGRFYGARPGGQVPKEENLISVFFIEGT